MTASNKDRVQAQFGRAAGAYVTSPVHAQGESLGILVDAVRPQPHWRALDVATGAGHCALAIAPRVAHVVALDLTEQMLVTAARLASERGITNLETRAGDAEALPFPDETFDLVTCRIAFHHFPNPARAVAEFVRVLVPGGTLGFTDNVAVEDAEAAAYYDAFERLRDPSHHEVPPLSRLIALFETAGVRVDVVRGLTKEHELHEWAARQRVSAADEARLFDMLRRLPPALAPLLAPRFAGGTAWFSLWEAVVVGRRLR